MIIFLYDRFGKQKGVISEYTKFIYDEELGKFDHIELTIIGNPAEKGDYIVWRDENDVFHENLISELTTIHDENGISQYIYAPNSITELNRNYYSGFNYYSSHQTTRALMDVLKATRWTLGRVDSVSAEQFYLRNETAYECLLDIINISIDEIYFRTEIKVGQSGTVSRTLNYVTKVGEDTDLQFYYGYDVDSIEKTYDVDEIYTRIHCYGRKLKTTIPDEDKDIYVRYGQEFRDTFMGINGGKDYVEDNAAMEKYGILDEAGNKVHSECSLYFDNIYVAQNLYYMGLRKLAEMSKPRITYSAKIADMYDALDNKVNVSLGDTIYVRDAELDERFYVRVVRIVKDYVNFNNTEITLGNTVRTLTRNV